MHFVLNFSETRLKLFLNLEKSEARVLKKLFLKVLASLFTSSRAPARIASGVKRVKRQSWRRNLSGRRRGAISRLARTAGSRPGDPAAPICHAAAAITAIAQQTLPSSPEQADGQPSLPPARLATCHKQYQKESRMNNNKNSLHSPSHVPPSRATPQAFYREVTVTGQGLSVPLQS